jgi:hypothetical protein
VYRIAVVGDSFIYGQGVIESERLSNRLAAGLNVSGPPFEVLNFGDSGADYEQNTRNTELAIAQARPDFVLLSWYQNDVVDPDGPRLRPYRLAWKLHYRLNPHSALYFVMNDGFARLQRATAATSHDVLLVQHALRTEDRLRRLLEVPRRHGLPGAMILWRHPSEGGIELAATAGLIDRVLAVCAEQETTCLDLGPALVGHASNDRLIVNRFDHHPNGRANALATEAVLAAFGPLWRSAAEAKRAGAVASS